MMRFAKVRGGPTVLRRTSRNCSSMSDSAKDVPMSRDALKWRALLVNGTLAFLGYKIGTTVLFKPLDLENDPAAKVQKGVLEHHRLKKQSLEASERKLSEEFQALRALMTRKKKEERALK